VFYTLFITIYIKQNINTL